ncbi:MAG: molybdate ABC transporter substrate-binding protein, partial [Desulfamplus sp.]|nr:molybdate ABC transporter substrate-binding protein [Desulfamplus sp.]
MTITSSASESSSNEADVSQEIIVSAAISLKNAFEETGRLYESKYGTKCILNFGASGALMRQVAGGAPVDIFASAAQKDMDEAEKMGLIMEGTRTSFAGNSMVLIVPSANHPNLAQHQDTTSHAISSAHTTGSDSKLQNYSDIESQDYSDSKSQECETAQKYFEKLK